MCRRVRLIATAVALAAATALVPGCGDDPVGPALVDTRAEVVGSWGATAFTVEQDGETTDVLAEGGSLELVFRDDGTTGGQLLVPGGAEDGGDLEASMEGTWSLQDPDTDGPVSVEVDQQADTFVRDVAWVGGEDRLTASASFAGTEITVVLQPLQL